MACKSNVQVRGIISSVMGQYYDNIVCPNKVYDISNSLYNMGCYEIALEDTRSIGNPKDCI